jgi:bifunctional non-homologous end joining protein LigD
MAQSIPANAPALMHPTEISRPIHHAGWVYEEKVDGWRIVALKADGHVRLVSRNGRDHTKRFPRLVKALAEFKPATFTLDGEVARLVKALAEFKPATFTLDGEVARLVKALAEFKPATFTLDGEVAVYDRAFISRFEWLRARPKDEPATLPVYVVFDVLELEGRDLRGKPLKERRRALERLIGGRSMIFPARRLSRDGFKAWEEAVNFGYEGIVAKDPESKYVAGRTLRWIKVKQRDYRKEARGFYRS